MVGQKTRRQKKMVHKTNLIEAVLDFMISKGGYLTFKEYESYKREVPYPARKVRTMLGSWSKLKGYGPRNFPEKWALIDSGAPAPAKPTPPPPAPAPAPPSIQEAMADAEVKHEEEEETHEEIGELSGTARPADGVFG